MAGFGDPGLSSMPQLEYVLKGMHQSRPGKEIGHTTYPPSHHTIYFEEDSISTG